MPELQVRDTRKLLLVPVIALRELCLSKTLRDETIESILRKTQNELLKYVQGAEEFSQADIDALYEKFRYGRRISLQLYLTPKPHPLPKDVKAIFDTFSSDLEKQDEKQKDKEIVKGDRAEQKPDVRMLRAADVESFGELTEFRYKYQMPITYLNEMEAVAHVYETRYGFIWINLSQQFVVLLSRDEQINGSLVSALSKALKTTPTQVRLPREVVNEHFEMEKIRRASYRDPERRISRSISGESGMWDFCNEELEQHEAESVRGNALYDEEINARVKSGIGLTQRKGKFYFTRILSASDLRGWAGHRLPNFVRDVREWSRENKALYSVPSRANASNTEKYFREQIVINLVAMKRSGTTEMEIELDFVELAAEVSSIRLGLSLSMDCETCGQAATECPGCRSQKPNFCDGRFVCDNCDRILVADGLLSLTCPDGHLQEGAVGSAISLSPKRSMMDQVVKAMEAADLAWDRDTDTFSLYDQMMYLQKKQSKTKRGDTHVHVKDSNIAAIGDGAQAINPSQSRS